MKKYLYRLLILFFAAVFLASGYLLLRYYLDSGKHQSQFRELASFVQEERNAYISDEVQESSLTPVTDPETGEKIWVLPEYAEIYQRNSHTFGWLRIEGTKIDYPVMQTPDQTDYYLYRDFNQQKSNHGCLYAKEDCTLLSDNITIHGHNMKDGSMFASLPSYKNRAFFENHRYIQFDTIYTRNTYEVVAVFLTTATDDGFPYQDFVQAKNQSDFDDYIRTCKALSYYDTGVTPQYGQQLITLSTCDYAVANGRLVVVAVKAPER